MSSSLLHVDHGSRYVDGGPHVIGRGTELDRIKWDSRSARGRRTVVLLLLRHDISVLLAKPLLIGRTIPNTPSFSVDLL